MELCIEQCLEKQKWQKQMQATSVTNEAVNEFELESAVMAYA